ncbi:hypothetical protein MCEMRE185_01362 [Candidatus Nanopelagicaceae bacterium]
MFNLKHPISIRLQRWMAVVLALGVLTFAPVANTNLMPIAQAGASPAADLDTIATYLRNYQGNDLRNPSFYDYTLDGNEFTISDGGGDMYDGGNYIHPWLNANTNYSTTSSGNSANALSYNITTAGTIDTDFKYVSLGYGTTRRPLTMLGTRTTAGNPIGFQKSGNAGADGGGSPTQGTLYTASTFNNFTVYAYYRQISGQGDPSICDLFMLIGQSAWGSTFGTINSYSNPSTDSNGAFFYSSGANTKNILAISTLLSKNSGVAVTTAEMQTVVQNYTKRIREAIGAGYVLNNSGGSTLSTNTNTVLTDTITASGFTGTPTISRTTSNTGISFSGNVLTVNVANAGTYYETFTATEGANSASLMITININAPPTQTTTNSTITTTVGRTASETMTVSNGTGTKTFALTSSVTQAGITLTNPSAGVAVLNIAATNVAAGTYIETITATDAVGAKVVSVINVTINPATTIRGETTTALLVTSGTARLETITASNGTGVKSFVLTSVSPTNAGITLDTSTASSGYARLMVSSSVAAGSYTASITATDTKGSAAVLSKSITVNSALSFALGATSTFGVPAGTAGYDTLTVTGGTAPRTVTLVGTPSNSGITVSAPTSTQVVMNVSSTVPAATYLETITVTDAVGARASHTVTLTVSGPIRFDSGNATVINTSVGRSASARIATLSGNTGKVFTKTSVSSPSSAAITLDTSTAADGYVTLNVSSAALAGSYVESITVVDSSNSRATWTVTVNVNPPPVLTYETATAGSNFSSLVFNGTNQYVTVPSNANLVMGSNYTIEWWQYQTDINSYPRIFSFGGNGLEVSIEGGTFYYWLNGSAYILASGVSVKNAWTHFAIVSRNNSLILYKNGVAQRSAVTGVAVTTSNLPSTGNLCIGSECNTTYYSMFGGRIANFTISNTPRYSGTSLSAASFTPGFFSTVDANTLLALGAVNSEAKFTDSSSFSRTVSYVNAPTGNSSHPSGGSANISLVTTQGITKRSSAFVASAGTGTKTFTITPTVAGVTLDTSLANNATIVIADTVTATNSTTARVINETVTATDSLGAATSFNVSITVNPPIALTATATSFSSTAGLMGYDTITATSGTGTGAITFSLESNPTSSGITLVPGASRNTVLTVARTVPSGTYYETVTATDSLGATTSIPITLTVNPGISIAGEGGITTLTTSNGAAAQLKVIATNGGSGKTFTKRTASVATNAGITLDTTGAASGFALVKVASTVPANTYLETVTVTDSQGGSASVLVTIVVNPAPAITGPSTLTMTAGTAATSTAFTASSGTGIKTLTLTGLNSGITMDTRTSNSGTLILASSLTSISTTSPRTIFETVTATDRTGAVAQAAIRITVNPAVIETATATSVTTTSGVSRTVTVYATQGTGNKTFTRTSATASSAITMSTAVANQAVLTIGALTSPGTYYETITATDTLNAATSILITITVNGPPTVSGPTSLVTTQGVAFNSPLFQAFGGNGTYTFSLVSNPTSAGISVSSPTPGYARISVASTVSSGTYNETLTVTDGLNATGFMTFTIRVNAPVALTGTQTVTTTYGTSFTTGYNTSGGTGPFRFSTTDVCTVTKSTFIGDGNNGTTNGTSYTVEQITGPGSCSWVVPEGVTTVDALVVGGGGSGGSRHAGGGGAGGLIYQGGISVTPGATTSVAIGAGGAPVVTPLNGLQGNNGASSQFGAISVVGGGGGGQNVSNGIGQTGGSGGGSAYTANGGSGTAGQGNSGGTGTWGDSEYNWAGGGGGGAGASGSPATNTGSVAGQTNKYTGNATAGAGGAGVSYSITGSAVCYAAGGGGSLSSGSTGLAGSGGGCGAVKSGGDGSKGNATAGDGVIATGSGGGAAGFLGGANGTSGRGGSGVVVVRYATPTTEPSDNRITFTATSAGSSGSAGLINLSIGSAVPAGSYTKTVIATDSLASASSSVTINITVNKANPVVTLSLPGAATSTQYGFGVVLSAQASTAGTVQFKDNGTEISGCGSKSTTSFVATCRWVPRVVATRTITAVFTPTDLSNYNTGITATTSVVVTKADTLTVTSTSEDFTFTYAAAAVTERFTVTGLAEIDSVTVSAASITTTYSGTANDSTSFSSATAPTKAGSNYAITPSALVFASGSASNYLNINYVPGVLTIARAANNGDFNYSNSNQLTYSPTGVDTPTVTAFGEATPAFTGSTPEKCTVNSSSGSLAILEAGTCSVTMDVPQGHNYLATSIARNVVINKASRTISLSATVASIKYGDTATVTTTISAGSEDGFLIYGSSTPAVCDFDVPTGALLAKTGSGTCSLVAAIYEGANYLGATSNTLSIATALADAPVVTTNPLDPVSYNYGNAISISPSFTVTGLKRADAASSVTFTYDFVASPAGTFSYSSTTVPTEGGIYSVTPSALILSAGSLGNYQSPSYLARDIEIEQIDQPELVITNLTGELTFPIKLITTGGAQSISSVIYLVTASTATNCRVVFGPIVAGGPELWSLQADSAGSCSVRAGKLQTRNYRTVISDTATVNVLEFTDFVRVPSPISNFSTGVTISSSIPITRGEISCTSNCTPTISSASPDAGYVGDMIVLSGTNFAGVTKVTFNTFIDATTFSNDPSDPDTRITVQVPAGVSVGEVGIEVVTPGGISFRQIVFELLP